MKVVDLSKLYSDVHSPISLFLKSNSELKNGTDHAENNFDGERIKWKASKMERFSKKIHWKFRFRMYPRIGKSVG